MVVRECSAPGKEFGNEKFRRLLEDRNDKLSRFLHIGENDEIIWTTHIAVQGSYETSPKE